MKSYNDIRHWMGGKTRLMFLVSLLLTVLLVRLLYLEVRAVRFANGLEEGFEIKAEYSMTPVDCLDECDALSIRFAHIDTRYADNSQWAGGWVIPDSSSFGISECGFYEQGGFPNEYALYDSTGSEMIGTMWIHTSSSDFDIMGSLILHDDHYVLTRS